MSNGHTRKFSDTIRAFFRLSNRDATSADMSPENQSPRTSAPKKPLPPSFSKHFKITKKARKLMDPQGRVCDLDFNNRDRVMIYMTPEIRDMRLAEQMEHNKGGLDEMLWNQPMLYEVSQKEPTLRITRKAIEGTTLEIFERDCFNEAEQKEYKDKPNMGSSRAAFRLGYLQARRYKHVYILSRRTMQKKGEELVRKNGVGVVV